MISQQAIDEVKHLIEQTGNLMVSYDDSRKNEKDPMMEQWFDGLSAGIFTVREELKNIITKWEGLNNWELAEQYEKSEKDCLWEAD